MARHLHGISEGGIAWHTTREHLMACITGEHSHRGADDVTLPAKPVFQGYNTEDSDRLRNF